MPLWKASTSITHTAVDPSNDTVWAEAKANYDRWELDLGLFTISNGGNESVKKTVFGFFEIVFVASREKNGASHCYESKR